MGHQFTPCGAAVVVRTGLNLISPVPDPVRSDQLRSRCSISIYGHWKRDLRIPGIRYALHLSRTVSGDVVLVHSAAGGVGSMLVQMARLRGLSVVGIVGRGRILHVF